MSKILLATMSLDIGGAETHIAELTRGLLARGHDVTIVSAGGVYVSELSEAGAKHYWAPLNTRRPRDMSKSLGVLSFLIKTERFDIVHAHARIPAFLCSILKRFYKFNFVTTAHWTFASGGLQKWLSSWGERSLAVSEDIKQYLISTYGVDEKNITVTVNGIDTGRFSPAVSGAEVRRELKIPEKAPVVVSVGRLDKTESAPTKMVQALLDSAAELSSRIKGLRIVIVGGGEDELRYFEQAAAINSQVGYTLVSMTGARSDINEILAAGDLFVGVSRSAMEALSTGVPAILAGSEGYLGLFAEDKLEAAIRTNFTCRGERQTEASQLLSEIAEYFEDFGKPLYEGRSARLGAYGREVIIKSYSVTRMVDDCEGVYSELLAAKSGGRPKRIVMSGYYGFDNAGDEAILQAVYTSVMSAHDSAEITVLSKNPVMTTQRYGYNAVGRFNPFRVLFSIRRSDALIFGGGSLLQDHTSTRSLMYYLAIIRVAKLFRKPVMIYANGIGPVEKPKNRERVRRAVESARIVTLRDVRSLEDLREMGVTRDDIAITGDPVYSMELPPEAERQSILRDAGIKAPFVAVSVRRHSDGAELFPKLANLLDMVHEKLGVELVFLPMQPAGDIAAAREVAALMRAPSLLPERSFSPRELMGILCHSELAVSMRLHTLIFAVRAGTPCAGIIIDPKLQANLEAAGLPGLGTPREFNAQLAFEEVERLFREREELSVRLTAVAEAQAERAKEDSRLVSKLTDIDGDKQS